MKSIILNHGSIDLPEDWSEMTYPQRLQGLQWLSEMTAGKITPFEWQLKMLLLLTDYKPSRRQSDTVRENLVRLAEQLTFAFTMEEDDDGLTRVRLNYNMHDCPVDCKTFFRRERMIETNMTARQYCEGSELLKAVQESGDKEERDYYADKLCSLMGVADCDEQWLEATRFAVCYWFTGVVLFWQEHPVYSVLYETDKSLQSEFDGMHEGMIDMGLQEVILELTQKGYANAGEMSVTDFFDAQVKMLRDNLHDAKLNGVKLPDLVKQTGIPLRNINRLI